MARLVWFVLLCLAAALCFNWLAAMQGMTSISWAGWQIELRTSLLVVVLSVSGLLFYWLYRLVRMLVLWPGWLGHNWQARRRKNGERALGLGMVAYAAGDYKLASKQARKAEKLLGSGLLADLLRAQAAHATGDDKAALRYFSALSREADTAYFGQIGLMRLYQQQGREAESLASAKQALQLSAQSVPAGLRILAQELKEQNWAAALDRLNQLMKQPGGLAPLPEHSDGFGHGQLGHPNLLAAHLCLLIAEQDDAGRLTHLKSALDHSPQCVEASRRLAIALGDSKPKAALQRLEKDFKAFPHDLLADLIGKFSADNDGQLVARLGRLAEASANSDEAGMIAASFALRRGIWASASALLDNVSSTGRTNSYFLLKAELCTAQLAHAQADEQADITAARQDALLAAAHAPHGPGWHCRACAASLPKWEMVCPSCDVLGQIDWCRAETAQRLITAARK